MRVAVLSDIHANLHGLQAVLAEVDGVGVDELWCLGDLVGYGADPDACVALAAERCDVCLVGNHDLAVRGDLPLREFSDAARLAARWTRATVRPETLELLRTLEPTALDHELGLFHASPRDPVWEYVVSLAQAGGCLDLQRHRVCLVGHSHVALSFHRLAGRPVAGALRRAGEVLDLSHGSWLLNPGSVGQPRDGDPRAAWLLLDLSRWTASYRRTEYDVAGAATAIRSAGLPAGLAERLSYGQ